MLENMEKAYAEVTEVEKEFRERETKLLNKQEELLLALNKKTFLGGKRKRFDIKFELEQIEDELEVIQDSKQEKIKAMNISEKFKEAFKQDGDAQSNSQNFVILTAFLEKVLEDVPTLQALAEKEMNEFLSSKGKLAHKMMALMERTGVEYSATDYTLYYGLASLDYLVSGKLRTAKDNVHRKRLQIQAEGYRKYMHDPMIEYNERQKELEETGSYIIGNARIIQDQRKYSKYLKAQRKNETQ